MSNRRKIEKFLKKHGIKYDYVVFHRNMNEGGMWEVSVNNRCAAEFWPEDTDSKLKEILRDHESGFLYE